MINKSMSITEILSKYPETKEVFINLGLKKLDDEKTLEMLSKISLGDAVKLKKLDINSFINLLEEAIKSNDYTADITVSTEEKIEDENAVNLLGLLPCPVRIPMLEQFKEFLTKNDDIKINYDLKAASVGLNWLKDSVDPSDSDKLADIFISAGFDFFFDKSLMGKFKEMGTFKDISDVVNYNADFNNDEISLKDTSSDYSMIGVVPAIFIVNMKALKDRKEPKSWKDILEPEFAQSISLPIADFDLFNSILIHIYKLYGSEGIKNLGRSLLSNMHPSQMVTASEPAVTIMPFFFSKMIKEDSPMKIVWPEEGAIISPIFMLIKDSKNPDVKRIVEFFSSYEVGDLMANQGFFPSIHPKVQNPTSGRKFVWAGWDFINNNDIGNLIEECKVYFEKGVGTQ